MALTHDPEIKTQAVPLLSHQMQPRIFLLWGDLYVRLLCETVFEGYSAAKKSFNIIYLGSPSHSNCSYNISEISMVFYQNIRKTKKKKNQKNRSYRAVRPCF